MSTNLQTEFAKAKALNEKRTPGEWKWGPQAVDSKPYYVSVLYGDEVGRICLSQICTTQDNPKDNAAFIANAPQQFACWEAAMGLIGELVGALVEAKQVLVMLAAGEYGDAVKIVEGKRLSRTLTLAESMGVKS